MKLIIGKMLASLKRLPHENAEDYTLQLKIAIRDVEDMLLFDMIILAIKKNNNGVMARQEPDGEGYSEIRILSEMELTLIFSIMARGIAVVQVG